MSETKASPHEVFISWSHLDRQPAEQAQQVLQRLGLRSWMADRTIASGKIWPGQIVEAIERCRVMVVLFSTHSNASPHVLQEVGLGFDRRKPIVVLRLDGEQPCRDLAYYFQNSQWLDATGSSRQRGIAKLGTDVLSLLGRTAVAPPVTAPGGTERRSRDSRGRREVVVRLAIPGIIAVALATVLVLLWAILRQPGSPRLAEDLGHPVAEQTPASTVLPEAAVQVDSPTSRGATKPGSLRTSSATEGPGTEGGASAPGTKGRAALVPVESTSPPVLSTSAGDPSGSAPVRTSAIVEKLIFRAESLAVHWEKAEEQATPVSEPTASREKKELPGGLSQRVIAMSNRPDEPEGPLWPEGNIVKLSVQFVNAMNCTVTLSQLQLHLLGLVNVFEDRIASPQAPRVTTEIKPVEVEENSPPRLRYVNLAEVFEDDDNPHDELTYSIKEQSELVSATIDAEGYLSLRFQQDTFGMDEVTVVASDPFGQTAQTTFTVVVKEAPARRKGVARGVMRFRSNDLRPLESVFRATPSAVLSEPRVDIEPHRVDLGTLLLRHAFGPRDFVGGCASGDLLAGDRTEVLPPNTARSFLLRVACSPVYTPGVAGLQDQLVGFSDRRRRLGAQSPRLRTTSYVLLLTVRANAASGESADLYTDHVYALRCAPAGGQRDDGDKCEVVPVKLEEGRDELPEPFLRSMLTSCVKSYEETEAYAKARLCESIPPGFDAQAISPACYYLDAQSPFRRTAPGSSAAASAPWPRTNLPFLLAVIRDTQPLLHAQFAAAQAELERKAEGQFALQLTFVRQQLEAGPKIPPAARSFVRVLRP